jgi:hypothetical protein
MACFLQDLTVNHQGGWSMQQETVSSSRFPVSNLCYDLVAVMHEKLTGLEAYDKYLKDAKGNSQAEKLFQQMRQQDEQTIQQLKQQLANELQGATTGAGSR